MCSDTNTSTCTDFKTPWGLVIFNLFPWRPVSPKTKLLMYRGLILLLTFISYTCYHLSRKPISVVKNQLLNCTDDEHATKIHTKGPSIAANFFKEHDNDTCSSFIDELDGKTSAKAHSLIGLLDTSFLAAYAIFMFFSGFVAERVNLRYFLTFGMILSGIFTILFGLGKSFNEHHMWFYILMQFIGGAVQSTGWPGVVTAVANWFGKSKKGLVFGIWNSHTSIGNILGGILAGVFVEDDWGLSFIFPGVVIAAGGLLMWFFMPIHPSHVGLDLKEIEPLEQRGGIIQSELLTTQSATTSAYGSYLERLSVRSYQATSSSSESSDASEPSSPLLPVRSQSSLETTPLLMAEDEDVIADESGYVEDSSVETRNPGNTEHAMTFWRAFTIPGVVEFSLSLFFAKLVSYTFLYWLPAFIKDIGKNVTNEDAAYIATLFDVGGIVGGIIAGYTSDRTKKPALVCVIMTIFAIPSVYIYNWFGSQCPFDPLEKNRCYSGNIGLLMVAGILVNGPYSLITTAVSADLGQHDSIKGNSKALATVTAIIDGTGSIGAAVGPYLAGALSDGDSTGTKKVFTMLEISAVISIAFLLRLVYKDILQIIHSRRQRNRDTQYEET